MQLKSKMPSIPGIKKYVKLKRIQRKEEQLMKEFKEESEPLHLYQWILSKMVATTCLEIFYCGMILCNIFIITS